MPRVSIIIPVYNGANYLREAIDSALSQTPSEINNDIEIIVINDGSRDGGATAAIAKSYGARIRFIEKENGGVSSALNRGIAEMRGEWFCWLSHDDRFLPGKTATQLAFVAQNPEIRVVCCNLQKIDEQGRVIGENYEHLSVIRNGYDVLTSWIFGSAIMIHRSALASAGPFNESNRTTQDLEMWLRLVEHHPIHLMPEILTQYRVHKEAGSRTEPGYRRDKDALFARMLDRYDAKYFDPEPTSRAEIYWTLARIILSHGSWKGARLALERARQEERSLRVPSMATFLSPELVMRWWWARAFALQMLRATVRRILPAWLRARLR
jgi:glycosyltransferase involved in cell wall biosynthesis